MPAGANRKHERQYEHIKESARERGSSESRAEEIAARTVNKNRARSGQARQRSRTSVEDISPQRRGGLRSGNRMGPGGRTKDQLYQDARRAGVEGRSKMTKAELERALGAR
ncbi:plasmid stabilization protein [Saccharopolyspora sp. MS10]|uniref:plasmid stabilization protein n=1 Tax=Saccharopolyspora sp. MS10 TaxID=3385973 RepID=UPI0039A0A25E